MRIATPCKVAASSRVITESSRRKGRGGMNWVIETDTYTLWILCIKWITNENLLCSTGNSTECSVAT